jgi:hypothetical protein
MFHCCHFSCVCVPCICCSSAQELQVHHQFFFCCFIVWFCQFGVCLIRARSGWPSPWDARAGVWYPLNCSLAWSRGSKIHSLLARAARSPISFFRGPARASSREWFWLGKELGLWLGQAAGSKSNTKRVRTGSSAAIKSNNLPCTLLARPWLARA